MEKEFVTYEQALALKELGFDEQCFGHWFLNLKEENMITYPETGFTKWYTGKEILAPLHQQAFRWFREKHGLYLYMVPEFYTTGINFNWQVLWYLSKERWIRHMVHNGTFMYGDNGEYPTQEDAESAAIDKMIQLTKEKG